MALSSGKVGITLMGLPGGGKSTLWKIATKQIPGWEFHDHDVDGLEHPTIGLGKGGIAARIQEKGDRAFLQFENDFTLENYGRKDEWKAFSLDKLVFASSGSIIRSPRLMRHLQERTHIILLDIPVDAVMDQIQKRSDGATRIIGMNGGPNGEAPRHQTLKEELRSRELLYRAYNDSRLLYIPEESIEEKAARLLAHIEKILG